MTVNKQKTNKQKKKEREKRVGGCEGFIFNLIVIKKTMVIKLNNYRFNVLKSRLERIKSFSADFGGSSKYSKEIRPTTKKYIHKNKNIFLLLLIVTPLRIESGEGFH